MSNLPVPINNTAVASLQHGAAITPSDTVNLTNATLAIYVGTTGNLKVMLNGDTVAITLDTVPVGLYYLSVSRVYATGTTASTLVALW